MDNLSEIIDIFSETTDRREMRSLFEDRFTEAESLKKDDSVIKRVLSDMYDETHI